MTGPLTSSTALYAKGGSAALYNYNLISIGVDSAGSCGLYATGSSSVYLCGKDTEPTLYTLTGCTGHGVCVNDADVTIYNMLIKTKTAYAAR